MCSSEGSLEIPLRSAVCDLVSAVTNQLQASGLTTGEDLLLTNPLDRAIRKKQNLSQQTTTR